MSLTIEEIKDYSTYDVLLNIFQKRMTSNKHTTHAQFSEEREKNRPNIRRFVAKDQSSLVVGWMTLEDKAHCIKIVGICTDPDNKKGVGKQLITKAVNCAIGKDLRNPKLLTLYNQSKGTGDRLYLHMGFQYEGDRTMKFYMDHRRWRPNLGTEKIGAKGQVTNTFSEYHFDDGNVGESS